LPPAAAVPGVSSLQDAIVASVPPSWRTYVWSVILVSLDVAADDPAASSSAQTASGATSA
jgi:hypothetical protein